MPFPGIRDLLGISLILPVVLWFNYSSYVGAKAPRVVREIQKDGSVWEYQVCTASRVITNTGAEFVL